MKKRQSHKNTNKLSTKENLSSVLPYGMLATKAWLLGQGFSVHALDNAVKSGTLLPLARGVYSQFSRKISWEGVVASLQRMEAAPVPPIVVGGLSALHLAGLGQYVPLGNNQRIHLYSSSRLPTWLNRLELPFAFEGHLTAKIWEDSVEQEMSVVRRLEWGDDVPRVFYSCPEKAILEVLCDLPRMVSFEHGDELMQNCVNLSPKKLDGLLQRCRNVKAKRLFFWLAKRHQYPWLKKLKVSDYDLGSGKRVVAIDGKLDKELGITVPANMS